MPEPGEQAIIQRMSELRANGDSLRDIAATLELEGYRSRSGGQWHPTQVARVLRRNEQEET